MTMNQWCRRLPTPAGVVLVAVWLTAGLVRAGEGQPAPPQAHPQIAELRKQIAGREKDPAGQPKPAFQPPATPAREALSRELARVDAAARAVPGDQRTGLDARLARAKAALEAGRLHLAIYDLEAVFTASAAFNVAREADAVKTLEDFERRWTTAGDPPAARRGGAVPVAVEALAASAEARAPVTYRAALPFARDSGVAAGLFYLGEAHALTAFASFARALAWKYLVARYRFASLRGGATPAPPSEARLAQARARLVTDVDHSIGQLFVEMADTLAASSQEDARRQAAYILDDVLPAYEATLEAPMTTVPAAADPAVTITLLRWPFT